MKETQSTAETINFHDLAQTFKAAGLECNHSIKKTLHEVSTFAKGVSYGLGRLKDSEKIFKGLVEALSKPQ